MVALTITSKGQITLRKDVLNHLGIAPGDKIALEKRPNGRLELKAMKPTGKISDLFGIFHREDGPVLTIEQLNDVIGQGWAGEI